MQMYPVFIQRKNYTESIICSYITCVVFLIHVKILIGTITYDGNAYFSTKKLKLFRSKLHQQFSYHLSTLSQGYEVAGLLGRQKGLGPCKIAVINLL